MITASMIDSSPHHNAPNPNIPNPLEVHKEKTDTIVSMTAKNIDETNSIIETLSSTELPPLPGQIFIDKVLPDNYEDNMGIDGNHQGLEEYDKEKMKQLEAENKEKQKALLASKAFPPMELNLKENPKNLFNLDV